MEHLEESYGEKDWDNRGVLRVYRRKYRQKWYEDMFHEFFYVVIVVCVCVCVSAFVCVVFFSSFFVVSKKNMIVELEVIERNLFYFREQDEPVNIESITIMLKK